MSRVLGRDSVGKLTVETHGCERFRRQLFSGQFHTLFCIEFGDMFRGLYKPFKVQGRRDLGMLVHRFANTSC